MKDALREIVGKSNVLTSPEDTAPYLTDWRRQYSAGAECVVRPGSTEEVARVVAACAQEGVAIVPQGGNTGLSGGSVPTGALHGGKHAPRLGGERVVEDVDRTDAVHPPQGEHHLAARAG